MSFPSAADIAEARAELEELRTREAAEKDEKKKQDLAVQRWVLANRLEDLERFYGRTAQSRQVERREVKQVQSREVPTAPKPKPPETKRN